MQYLEVPAWEYYGWEPETLRLPDGWDVRVQKMNGHEASKLTMEEVADGLQHPVGSKPLRELAKGKRKCCIIFDDMTRPTRQSQMLPAVLDELNCGGLSDDQIVFVMATGAHHGRLLFDFQKKLGEEVPERFLVFNHKGEEVPERFLVFNHNCYENTVDLGETSRGTPVHVNREVISCDLKVALGAMMPHFGYGFGGGSKMLLTASLTTTGSWRGRGRGGWRRTSGGWTRRRLPGWRGWTSW